MAHSVNVNVPFRGDMPQKPTMSTTAGPQGKLVIAVSSSESLLEWQQPEFARRTAKAVVSQFLSLVSEG